MTWARYFDERMETMPAAWTRRLEEELLADQVARCYERAPFYRRKLAGAGVRPEHVDRLEDLRRLPFTTKEELRESQDAQPPFGDFACADPVDIVRVHLTSGRPESLSCSRTRKGMSAPRDVRVASPNSRFGCPEVAIGLSISNGFSALMPRTARRLVLTGELVRAEEALRLGLVDVVADDVESEARRGAERVGGLAPHAVAGSKRLLNEAEREALERALDREAALCAQLFETADAREGLAAFLEKRQPRFRGA